MSSSENEANFVPREDDDETLWEVLEILAESRGKYRVRWAGNDPTTGRPWPPSWVPAEDCTDDLVDDWKRRKAQKKGAKGARTSQKKRGGASERTSSSKGSQMTRQAELSPSVDDIPDVQSAASSSKALGSEISRRGPPVGVKRKRITTPSVHDGSPVTAGPSIFGEITRTGPPVRKKRKKPKATPADGAEVEHQRDEPNLNTASPSSAMGIAKIGPPVGVVRRDLLPVNGASTGSSRSPAITKVGPPLGLPPRAQQRRDSPPKISNDVPAVRRDPFQNGQESLIPETQPGSERSPTPDVIPAAPHPVSKTLRPVPILSPSAFRPHLPPPDPTQDTIEQFSSPEKESGTRRIFQHAGRFSSVTPSVQEEQEIVLQMEDAYVDLTGGADYTVEEPESAGIIETLLGPQTVTPAVSTPVPSFDYQESPEGRSVVPLPATASTQQAMADSQSLNELSSQICSLSEALAAKDDLIADLEKKVDGCQTQISQMISERDELKEALAASTASYEAQTQVLSQSEQRCAELKTVVAGIRQDGLEMLKQTFEGHVARLQDEVERWKGLCQILTQKDERTNDQVREKAALVPELRVEIAKLEEEKVKAEEGRAEADEERRKAEEAMARAEDEKAKVEEENARRQRETARLQEEILTLKRDKNDLQEQVATLNKHQAQAEGVLARLAELQSRLDASEDLTPDTTYFVCQYIEDGIHCHERFLSAEDTRKHVHTTHYPHLQEYFDV